MEFDRLREVTAPAGGPSAMARAHVVFAHPDDEVIAIGERIAGFENSDFFAPPHERSAQFRELAGQAERELMKEKIEPKVGR